MKSARDNNNNLMQAVQVTTCKMLANAETAVKDSLYRVCAIEDSTLTIVGVTGNSGLFIPKGCVEYFMLPKGVLKVTGNINLMGDF